MARFGQGGAAAAFSPAAGALIARLNPLAAQGRAFGGYGLYANFFDLGGSSLQVLQVKQHLETALGLSIPVIDFFRYPTVAELANHLWKASSASNAPA